MPGGHIRRTIPAISVTLGEDRIMDELCDLRRSRVAALYGVASRHGLDVPNSSYPFATGKRVRIVDFLLDVIDKQRGTCPGAPSESRAEPAMRVLHYGLARSGFLVAWKEQEVRSTQEALLACRPEERLGHAALIVRGLMQHKREHDVGGGR